MGISDRHYFAWLGQALDRFERETGALTALCQERPWPDVWCFGEQGPTPPIERLVRRLDQGRPAVTFFDKFPAGPGVRAQDINALHDLPDNACDVLTLFRASMFVADPTVFLPQLRRLLRPGGLAVVDWLHGQSDAPVLDFPLDPRYGGRPSPFLTTYADAQFIGEFPAEFEAFIRHLNRPPSWANVEHPGARVPLGDRLRRLVGGGPGRGLTRASYLEALQHDMEAAGKCLIEPPLLEQYFKVAFRDARYLYKAVRKFNLYLLTVLIPVGK